MAVADAGALQSRPAEAPLQGLPPLLSGHPRVLILGSMPGAESLRRQQYYAHPRNAFWPILGDWLGLPADADYVDRVAALTGAGIALWDVLARCRRAGSLDAAIDLPSAEVNDLAALLRGLPSIRRVLCNGALAAQLYRRHVSSRHPGLPAGLRLPSTSPAHAALALAAKREQWQQALQAARMSHRQPATAADPSAPSAANTGKTSAPVPGEST